MQLNKERRDEQLRSQALFTKFLTEELPGGVYYKDRVEQMIRLGKRRLTLDMSHMFKYDRSLSQSLIQRPSELLVAFEEALRKFVENNPTTLDLPPKEEEFFVGIEGEIGANHVSPRGLTTELLRSLVCVEGIVTKVSLVRPKIVKSVHYCEATQEVIERRYIDEMALSGNPTGNAYPVFDARGNPISFEIGLSVFRDTQAIYLQEMPERAPAGQLPRSVKVHVENDLVDCVKPGDRVRIFGVYRAIPHESFGSYSQGIFETVVLGNNVQLIQSEVLGPKLSTEDIQNIKTESTRPTLFDDMAASLAPSIYGHEYIKKAILLQLLGGVEKNLENGAHLRGDINVLLIGDPSTAKSQMLRFVLNTAPLAVSTSGRGSSGVGLTAAVTSDSETKERRLEAGAMVLADRGIVCIDEFDKMSVEDRVAIHEVMEQQTVTIAKAGIHASLNARCSVLAAANPIFGKYDRNKKPGENIALPDSLLSRFDLLFIVLDNLEAEHDRAIANHVLSMHRYKGQDETRQSASVNAVTIIEDQSLELETSIYQKYDVARHGARALSAQHLYSVQFIQKYLLYAKRQIEPVLTDESSQTIVDAFEDLRGREDIKTLPVTPRMLETMIRLSAAHAKCRLSYEIQTIDIEVALGLMKYALYHDADTHKSHKTITVVPDAPEAPEEPPKAKNTKAVTVTTRKRTREEPVQEEARPAKKKKDAPKDPNPPASSVARELIYVEAISVARDANPGAMMIKRADLRAVLAKTNVEFTEAEEKAIEEKLIDEGRIDGADEDSIYIS